MICKDCQKEKTHYAKGLCYACWKIADYYKNHKKKKAQAREQRKNNPETYRQSQRNCYFRNRDKNNARVKKNNWELKMAVVKVFGGKCAKCGYSKDIRAFQVDHVNSNGKMERKVLGLNTSKIYRKIVRGETEGYQLLCANCNLIKRFEKGEWGIGGARLPHNKEYKEVKKLDNREKVRELRAKGFGFREIGKVMGFSGPTAFYYSTRGRGWFK